MSVTVPAHRLPLIRNDETMRYRPLGKTGLMVSALSFGCMRLSEDMELNERLISRAIDLGINYFETTRGYCGGQCQQRVAPGLRKKLTGVIVSGKARVGPDVTAYTFRKEIERQLDILGLDHFKFFQVGWFRWPSMEHLLRRGGALDALRQAQDEGLIHHVGFTGHDTVEGFRHCIETGLFDTITIPYNLINRSYEPLMARCVELGIGVVAMCPVAGGTLSFAPTEFDVRGLKVLNPAGALRFVLSNPTVSTACSGMNTMEMLEENVRTVKAFDPAEGAAQEAQDADMLRQKLGDEFCTGCNYCAGCPVKLNVGQLMQVWQWGESFGLADWAHATLRNLPEDRRPALCTECGQCETRCPNKIQIRRRLKELAEMVHGKR